MTTGTLTTQEIEALAEKAKAVSHFAYVSYSQFRVGAAILTVNGNIYAGTNFENSVYKATHAEHSAVANMISHGETKFRAVVVYSPTSQPITPCGHCRQLMYELSPDAIVIGKCDSTESYNTTVSALLPGAFAADSLNLQK
jgi:cytidine deaminase